MDAKELAVEIRRVFDGAGPEFDKAAELSPLVDSAEDLCGAIEICFGSMIRDRPDAFAGMTCGLAVGLAVAANVGYDRLVSDE